jgi:serine acetyltransferase
MKAFRICVTAVSIVVEQTIVCAVALAPSVFVWRAALDAAHVDSVSHPVVISLLIVPSYVLFALCLMPVSAATTWMTGARTPQRMTVPIADMSWPLMRWVHYMTATHIVRLFAGTLFRGSPMWTAYVRMNGARIGRHVYINTLSIADHNLLEIGDDVVIGADVHISGHTVEGGVLKTAPVRVGSKVMIGVGSVIDIDVDIGSDCQLGALTFVPKHSRIAAHAIYVGIPARHLGELSM